MVASRLHVVHACITRDEVTRARITEIAALRGRQIVHVDEHDVSAVLPEITALVCSLAPRIDWSIAERLELLQFLSSGIEASLPLTGLPTQTLVANARGVHVAEMRDHALALMLSFTRSLPEFAAQQRRAEWRPIVAGTLRGKTVAILGLGEVGRAIAAACASLGMRVYGSRMSIAPTLHVDHVFGPNDLRGLLEQADFVIVTLPLTDRTRGLLSRDAFTFCRPSAVLVHLSRGGIVDEEALTSALVQGKLKGAALDVFETEPLPTSSPLWSTPNLVITAHSGGLLEGHLDRVMALALDNVAAVEQGALPSTLVDVVRGY